MKKASSLGLLLLFGSLFISQSIGLIQDVDPITLVDPFIGTGGVGYGAASIPPGPRWPFGKIWPSPDSCDELGFAVSFQHYGGYDYSDSYLRCFSHTHLDGAGVQDGGNFGIMPVTNGPALADADITPAGYRSSFRKETEKAVPGYYAVHLDKFNVDAEVTSGLHVASHRYTFNNNSPNEQNTHAFIIIDAGHALDVTKVLNASIQYDITTGLVTGFQNSHASFGGRLPDGLNLYFAARFSAVPFSAFGFSNGQVLSPRALNLVGPRSGIYFDFGSIPGSAPVQVEVFFAISHISIDQAIVNLNAEYTPSVTSFDSMLLAVQNEWRTVLNQVDAQGPIDAERTTAFYTALYHTHLAPMTFSEANGVYLAVNSNEATQLPQGQAAFYTELSLWDIHRTEMPLMAILQPQRASDIAKSIVTMGAVLGGLPRWPFANNDGNCMPGSHANVVLADFLLKGITDFDVETAYELMRAVATGPAPHSQRDGIEYWSTVGYVPIVGTSDENAATLTLEYSFDDHAIAVVASVLGGLEDDVKLFLNRSQGYKYLWNPENKFLCPLRLSNTDSGSPVFACPDALGLADPFSKYYTEGDAWQYRWLVPQDVPGLVELFGSPAEFAKELDDFCALSTLDASNDLPNPYLWLGNEPDLLALFLFPFADRPDLTQKWSRWAIEHKYGVQPDSIPGNDDYGTMSAWSFFNHAGFYPLAGTEWYLIGSPMFASMTIKPAQRPQGTVLQIVAHDNSNINMYVQKVLVNGQQLMQPAIRHSDLIRDGQTTTVEFFMGAQPAPLASAFPTPASVWGPQVYVLPTRK